MASPIDILKAAIHLYIDENWQALIQLAVVCFLFIEIMGFIGLMIGLIRGNPWVISACLIVLSPILYLMVMHLVKSTMQYISRARDYCEEQERGKHG